MLYLTTDWCLQVQQSFWWTDCFLPADTDLVDELAANPYTLLRQFKQAIGITPHAPRMNCHIEGARTLLQNGMEISEVALACGFFD